MKKMRGKFSFLCIRIMPKVVHLKKQFHVPMQEKPYHKNGRIMA
jgi:hypothetical protein